MPQMEEPRRGKESPIPQVSVPQRENSFRAKTMPPVQVPQREEHLGRKKSPTPLPPVPMPQRE